MIKHNLLVINYITSYIYCYRLFLVHIDLKQDIQATVIYAESEISALSHEFNKNPILILGNNGDLKSILPYDSVRINVKWRKW